MCLTLSKCCCCIGLEKGTKIIGFLNTILAALTVALFGTLAVLGHLPKARLVFYIALAVCAVFEFVFGWILIRATFKKRPQQFWPWLVLCWSKAVALLALTVTGMVLVAYGGAQQDLSATAEVSLVISVYFVYALVLLYFTSVVNNRRQEMVLENYWATKRLLQHAKNQYYYV